MHIVIVGGGTAGWLAALALVKVAGNHHKVTVVESESIGIVGAGEGTTSVFSDFIKGSWFNTGVDLADFQEKVHATKKIGIRHVGWTGTGSSYFAPLDGTPTGGHSPDRLFLAQLARNKPKFHTCSELGVAYETGRGDVQGAYHFDAFKVGEYFKDKLTSSGEVTHVNAIVQDVKLSESGFISALVLDNGQELSGDFFFDCTGFRRVLLKKLRVAWHSHQKHLPVNAAIAFQQPLDPAYKEITTATALKNGWVWQIPTAKRYGCGYVYSDKHTSRDAAYAELQALYGDVDILRDFNFDAGRSEVLWEKNCVGLGLAAAFAEPLEATSIHTTLIQILVFVYEYLQPTLENTTVKIRSDKYNADMTQMYDDMKDFIVLHYMGGRTDSEFWRMIDNKETTTPWVEYVLDLCARGVVISPLTFNRYYDGMAGVALYKWVLAGLGKITDQSIAQNYERLSNLDAVNQELSFYQQQWGLPRNV